MASSLTPYPSPLALPPALLMRKFKITHEQFCKSKEKKKSEDLEEIFFICLAKKLDPDLHHLEKWDPDPHQNVLDPPHCSIVVDHAKTVSA